MVTRASPRQRTQQVGYALLLGLLMSSTSLAAECVVFLHGLARTSSSMNKAAAEFAESGYRIANVDYPSRHHPIETLAPLAMHDGLSRCEGASAVHFVTHSLGGIIVRHFLKNEAIDNLGRVVMFAPPNQGSEVVDSLQRIPGFKMLNGPAGLQLGTGADSIPRSLGPVEFELGVIAGNMTFNPILSQYLGNPDDGKVSVKSTRVAGMSDFLVLPHSHPFIMKSDLAIEQARAFIATGRFSHERPAD